MWYAYIMQIFLEYYSDSSSMKDILSSDYFSGYVYPKLCCVNVKFQVITMF